MRAMVFLGQEDIQVQEYPDPVPEEGEVLIRVEACGICGTDLHAYKTGMYAPGVVIGHEFGGVVAAVGAGVVSFRPGDRVTASPGIGCGRCFLCRQDAENLCEQSVKLGVTDDGAMAELVRVPQSGVHHVPENLSLKEACFTEPFSIALHGLNQSRLRLGDRVAIIGAGPIGLCLLQTLRMAGAGAVWVVEPNPFRLDLAMRLGADRVLNPREVSPLNVVSHLTNGSMADIVFECAGFPETITQAPMLVRRGGQVVVLGICDQPVDMDFLSIITSEMDIQTAYYSKASEFARTIDFMAKGSLRAAPLITLEVPFERVVESFRTLLSPDSNQMKVLVRPAL
ncbi:MAG: alcohol dehydrogenase catalytic domain-containing protein [Dehalococcoidia bacterium]|nr:alcohol dehydrogenase catalytic domain-containing protein [Dehalococcoidia bacterium]